MSQETQASSIADIVKRTVVYQTPGMDAVTVRQDVVYRATDTETLTLDLYAPPDRVSGARTPAVVIVAGYPGAGVEKMLGCKFKDMGSSVSWARLMAASGLTAITYSNREPVADLLSLLRYVRKNAESLGIDETRIGIWASSGNVSLALSLLLEDASQPLRCAALCYGFMLDLDGATGTAEASRQFGFVNPCAGKSMDDLAPDVPLFLVRAGHDQFPHLNESIDRFVAGALAGNLPVVLVNHPEAPHAFDLFLDNETSRLIIRQILAFLRYHLRA
jgi:acetyl esterase/lipase